MPIPVTCWLYCRLSVRENTTLVKDLSSDPKFPIWISQSKDKADLLVSSWFPNRAPQTSHLPHAQTPSPTRPYHSVTFEEVEETLNDRSNTTAPSISGLNYLVWKWVLRCAPDELTAVVRAAVALGIHHSSWKQSLVAVIPKNNKKDMSLPKSHRPIQLIECLGKLVEKIVACRITFDLGKHKLMPFNQFGRRSNSSCPDLGLSLTHDIQTARERGLVSSFLAVDIKGFFNHVDHVRLIDVLKHKGFPPNIVCWVQSFLQERFVRVQVDDHVRNLHPQLVGVPQGSPVSLVLACIYSSAVLEHLNKDPIFAETGNHPLPVGPRAYVDDFGFLAISDDLKLTYTRCEKPWTTLPTSSPPSACPLTWTSVISCIFPGDADQPPTLPTATRHSEPSFTVTP